MRTLLIDTETYCEIPIERGHHRYAEEAEVTLVPFAWDDEEPQCIDCTLPENANWRDVVQEMLNKANRIYIHNAAFDITVLARQGVIVPIWKVVDTMVQAMAHSLPGSLDKLSEIFKLGDQGKVKDGKRLMHLFAKPRPKNQKLRRATRETHPEDWKLWINYAIYDVVAMRALLKFLPKWNIFKENSNQDVERTLWELDQKINNRGFAVDTELATAALRAAGAATARLAGEVQVLTNGAVQSTTQRGRTLEYLQAMGVDINDMKGGTVDTLLRADDEDPGILDPEARAILENRSQAAATSPAKYRALLGAVSEGNRLRGALQFCGALRTARWGGRIFQPQNLPRPKLKQHRIDSGIAAMKAGVEDIMYDDVMALCTSAIRGCIVAASGKKLVIADLANIEGRMLAWLAGETWKLQAFKDYDTFLLDPFGQKIPDGKGGFKRKGPDLYVVGAAGILGKPLHAVTGDDRQKMGKVPELACGYQGALGAFNTMAALYGIKLPDEEVLEIVRAWRTKNARIKQLWYDVERAAVRAVRNPGETFTAGKLKFRQDGSWLRMLLPSGRYLCYPHAQVGEDCSHCGGHGKVWSQEQWDALGDEAFIRTPDAPREFDCDECDGTGMTDRDKLTYMGVDQYTRKWKRLRTYGGKLVENATQAASRDVLAHGMLEAEQAGYEVVLSVHDELLCEVPDDPRFTVDALCRIMANNPEWAEGLPLAAAGFSTTRYRKD